MLSFAILRWEVVVAALAPRKGLDDVHRRRARLAAVAVARHVPADVSDLALHLAVARHDRHHAHPHHLHLHLLLHLHLHLHHLPLLHHVHHPAHHPGHPAGGARNEQVAGNGGRPAWLASIGIETSTVSKTQNTVGPL
jgi:hypothetical protein